MLSGRPVREMGSLTERQCSGNSGRKVPRQPASTEARIETHLETETMSPLNLPKSGGQSDCPTRKALACVCAWAPVGMESPLRRTGLPLSDGASHALHTGPETHDDEVSIRSQSGRADHLRQEEPVAMAQTCEILQTHMTVPGNGKFRIPLNAHV